MTQEDLVMSYIKENKIITPAKMGGILYGNNMFGSETTRVCRRLRSAGVLKSFREGKFVLFHR